jgi:hypothetical protein
MIQQILTALDGGDHMNDGLGMMGGFGGGWWMWFMIIGGMFLIPLLSIWTYQNAHQSGENALLWALVVFFTMGLGIILYALLSSPNRSNLPMNSSSSPSHPLNNNSSEKVTYTPSIQDNPDMEWRDNGSFCENCGSLFEVNDSFCSKCGTSVGSR